MVVVDLYSIGTLSCMREREREMFWASRRVGGWVQGRMMKEKGRIGKYTSVVVVEYGLWFTFHFCFFPPTLWYKFRQQR